MDRRTQVRRAQRIGSLLALTVALVLMVSGCNLIRFIDDVSDEDGTPIAEEVTPTYTPTATHTATPSPTPTLTITPRPGCVVRADWFNYVVQPGDTLSRIAQRVGLSTSALVQGNCLANANLIFVGQVLKVPVILPPTATPTSNVVPRILSFTLEPVTGGGLMVRWQTQNVASVNLMWTAPNGEVLGTVSGQPANGTLGVPEFSPRYAPQVTYILYAVDALGRDILDPAIPTQRLAAVLQVPVMPGFEPARMSARPEPVPQGGQITLEWDVPGQTTVAISRSRAGQAGYDRIASNLPAQGTLVTTLPMEYIDRVDFIVHSNTDDNDVYAGVFMGVIPSQTPLTCPQPRQTAQGVLLLTPDNRRSDGCSTGQPGQTLDIIYPDIPAQADRVNFFFLPLMGTGCNAPLGSAIALGTDSDLSDGANINWVVNVDNCAGLLTGDALVGSGYLQGKELPIVVE